MFYLGKYKLLLIEDKVGRRLLLLNLVLFCLTACQKQPNPVRLVELKPCLPCKICGINDKDIIAGKNFLEKNGIRVLTIGQNYLIKIPADKLFVSGSPKIIWSSHHYLNHVACFLKQFRKIAITITTYSSKCLSVDRDRALTLARSRSIGYYLWNQGVDSRLLFTRGLGRQKPIFRTNVGNNNSRVEITFKRAILGEKHSNE